MKSTAICLLGAAFVLAVWPTASWAALDELEDLLSVEAIPPRDNLPSAPFFRPDSIVPSLTPSPGATFDERGWSAGAPSESGSSSRERSESPTAAPQEQKPLHGLPMNAVPEPSAWLLAVAALLYFVVFGRRRRLV